jgi:DNA-binding XRE family transcriptional regulator
MIDVSYKKNAMDEIHIGNRIKQVLKMQRRSPAWLAEQLHKQRSTVYDIFERSSVDTELLIRISCVLNYNFLEIYYLQVQERLRVEA